MDADIEKRLDKIDSQLNNIQEVMLETALQQKDIDLLKEEVKELKAEQTKLKGALTTLKQQPTKDKADKWAVIEKAIFHAVLVFLGGCIVYIIKTGLIGNVLG